MVIKNLNILTTFLNFSTKLKHFPQEWKIVKETILYEQCRLIFSNVSSESNMLFICSLIPNSDGKCASIEICTRMCICMNNYVQLQRVILTQIHPYIYLSISLYIYLNRSIYLSIYLASISVYLPIFIDAYMFNHIKLLIFYYF